jgi:alpha-tubulin suppressor-like RCC1 family protein
MNIDTVCSSVCEASVFVADDDTFYTWGPSWFPYLGLGVVRASPLPSKLTIPGDPQIVSFTTGGQHWLAVSKGSQIIVWGKNNIGQLGLGHVDNVDAPTVIPNFPPQGFTLSQLCAGDRFTVALMEDGTLFTWGCNDSGQLGHGDLTSLSVPTRVQFSFPSPIIDVACGARHVFARTKSGEGFTWGQNEDGMLGFEDNTKIPFLLPTPVPSLRPYRISKFALGSSHSMALTQDGQLLSWGYNSDGALGLGHKEPCSLPTLVPNFPSKVADIACGWFFSLALLRDGSLWAWGDNCNGQLGSGDIENVHTPKKVEFPEPVEISGFGCGCFHTFVISKKGELWIWGSGSRVGFTAEGANCPLPTKAKLLWKAKVPVARNWRQIFLWLFLGKGDKGSEFSVFPVEVFYHFVCIFWE